MFWPDIAGKVETPVTSSVVTDAIPPITSVATPAVVAKVAMPAVVAKVAIPAVVAKVAIPATEA